MGIYEKDRRNVGIIEKDGYRVVRFEIERDEDGNIIESD